VPLLIDFLPRSIAQLMVLNAERGPQQLYALNKIRRMDILKSNPELVE